LSDVETLNRLRWKCRRGMLELDLLLLGFVENGLDTLDQDEPPVFERLLEMSDQVLQGWLLGDVVPTEKQMVSVIRKIRTAAWH
jgi:antitoxin CptB